MRTQVTPIARALALLVALQGTAIAGGGDAGQLRGIWLRPEASVTSVTVQLDNIRKAGFNSAYVETFYHGFTIYPSRFVPIRPEMEGTDYLKLYIEEGRKRGINIHAWMEVFYWEVDTKKHPKFPKTPLFEKHPEWRTTLRDGSLTDKVEDAHIFANPAHPEVRRFIADYVEEMIRNYDIAGVNLDYIRYSHGYATKGHDAGYDDYTRAAYRKVAGVDPVDIEYSTTSPAWRKWVEYREEQVIDTVRMVKERKDAARKDVILSAAIFAAPPETRYTDARFQNWREMLKRGYLDVIAPMVYDESLAGVERGINIVKDALPDGSKAELMPIFAVQRRSVDMYSGTKHPPIADKAKIVTRLALPGFSIFCYDWMMDSDEGLDLLKEKSPANK